MQNKTMSRGLLAAMLWALAGVSQAAFQAGAAKIDSTPNQELCTGGYGIFCGWKASEARPNAVGGEDRLYTRALVIESEGRRVAIVTATAIGIFAAYKSGIDPETGRLVTPPGLYDTRLRIAREIGIASDHVFIQSDHSHRGPDTIGIWGGVPASYLQQVQDDMVAAVRAATARLEPAELFVGAIDGGLINCDDTNPGDGVPLRCGVDSLYAYGPNAWVDDEFRVLEARRPGSDERIATFANYSPHATVLDDTGDGVYSGDWTGWLAELLDDEASGAVGLATVGSLGRTDFNPGNNSSSPDRDHDGDTDGNDRNLNRELAARARLNHFMTALRDAVLPAPGVRPFEQVTGSGVSAQENFLREPVTNPIFYGNYAPLVGVPDNDGRYPSETEARIDRSTVFPWLSGNTLGTLAGALRIGDLFFATAPGEEFPNAQQCLRDGCGIGEGMSGKVVAGADGAAPQMHFFLGATNDFLGYMGPASTYDQVAAQGAFYFSCPPGDMERQGRETLDPITSQAGYDAGRLFDERSCPDHFILMSSPTIGDHVNCAIQNAAQSVGFGIEGADPTCVALTVADSRVAPPVLAADDGSRSGQGGVAGAGTDLAGDAQGTADAAGSGNPVTVVGNASGSANNAADNAEGTLTEDGDASLVAVINNAAGSLAAGDPQGLAEGLARDGERLLLGYTPDSEIRAGVGVVDMTPDVGYCAGQYCDSTNLFDGLGGDDIDPFLTHKTKHASYGVQSRLTARAIVVEGNNGQRVALLKTDNYLAQDTLIRRVAQLLREAGSKIGYEQILHSATHNHSSSYSSTTSWGVWIFEDVFDARFFENQARKMAEAILTAESTLQPARMGATTVRHKIYKGNVVRLATADDGTPAGYPLEYGDLGLVVMRFDALTTEGPKPLAVWMNWGEHPESLDDHDLHTADFLSALERFVDREVGAPLVFTQGDVGSAENSGNKTQVLADDGSVCGDWAEDAAEPSRYDCAPGEGTLRVFEHTGFVQFERNVRFLADDVIKGWKQIGEGHPAVQVPMSGDFPVDYRSYWAPGPLSHPYPGVSNCNTDRTVEGDTGVPIAGLPDCGRYGVPGENPITGQAGVVYETMRAEGVPLPDHYSASAFTGVEENLRIYLQAFRLGEVLLASCACEAQVDLILNLETRTDQVLGNQYNGFDWACLIDEYKNDPQYAEACELQKQYYDPTEFPTPLAGNAEGRANAEAIARMRAQIHNDARGWDAPENVLHANSEPNDPSQIWGNFTHEELPPEWGYKLPVGLGHAGDYVGYTVSYREFMNRDHYRKALTAFGPHTADYMVSRLVRMAGAMKGGPELLPDPHDSAAQADEARQRAVSTAVGQAAHAAHDAWLAALPLDVGPAQIEQEPAAITHFQATEFHWRGGNTQVDNPLARVQRNVDGIWQDFADNSGEVQTRVFWPQGLEGVAETYSGQFAWRWAANFEAYTAFPARLGSTPFGEYRFVVDGCINDGAEDPAGNLQGRAMQLVPPATAARGLPLGGRECAGGSRPYQLVSQSFTVSPLSGAIPRSYASASFPYVEDRPDSAGRDDRFCETCSFRPWASERFGADADSDADGVLDLADYCPQTAAATQVDAQGCAAAQRDSDDDGINDANDNCPLTPNGAQDDSDSDGVGDACELSVQLSATPVEGDITDGPLTVTFTASASNGDPNGGTLSYVYYWGDGGNSGLTQQTTISHPYDKAGTYVARVAVVDENNNGASDAVTIRTTTTVTVDPDPVIIEAVLGLTLSGSVAPVTAFFDGSGSSAPEGAIYRFDFGGGQIQQGASAQASKTYALAGQYTVTLTVIDPNDPANQDQASVTFTVGDGQQATAQLKVSPSTANIGQTVTFDAGASLPSEGANIVSYTFDFGDGSAPVTRAVAAFPDDAGIVTYAYDRSGSFTPSVTVTDDAQQQVTVQAKVSVRPPASGGGNTSDITSNGGGGALGGLLLLPLILLGLRRRRN